MPRFDMSTLTVSTTPSRQQALTNPPAGGCRVRVRLREHAFKLAPTDGDRYNLRQPAPRAGRDQLGSRRLTTMLRIPDTTRLIPDMALLHVRRLFTVDDYYRMADMGLLGPDERTELLDGEVVYQMPINPRHAGCVIDLAQTLVVGLAGRALISTQNPIRLSPLSEPQPDIAVLRARVGGYRTAHPQPADVLLLIEVADSSLELDRRVKVPLYAAAGIAEVWLVDLVNGVVEVYRDPDDGTYRHRRAHTRAAVLSPGSMPDLSLRVDEILGPLIDPEEPSLPES